VPGAAAGPLPRDSHTGVQAPDTDGVWFDVREGRDVAPAEDCVEASGAWHAQQWLNAFCVLVRELGVARETGCFKHARQPGGLCV